MYPQWYLESAARRILTGLLLIIVSACSSDNSTVVHEALHPYDSKMELTQPAVFSPGVVSTAAPEFATSFSAEGRTVYFNHASADRSVLRIMQSRFADGKWGRPEPLALSDGTYRDVDPHIGPEGNRLYFCSNRPGGGSESTDNFDVWYVQKVAHEWSEPVNLGRPVNSAAHEVFVSIANSGNIYFARSGGAETKEGIYRCSGLGEAHIQTSRLDLPAGASNPLISPDESFLIFSQQVGDQSDLFVVYAQEGGWGYAEPLNQANSEYSEFAPALSPDGRYLFFTSERPGIVPAHAVQGRPPGDIYQISLSALTLGERKAFGN